MNDHLFSLKDSLNEVAGKVLVGGNLFGSHIIEVSYREDKDMWRLKTADGKQHLLTGHTVQELVAGPQIQSYSQLISQHAYGNATDFAFPKKINMKEMKIAEPVPLGAGDPWGCLPYKTITVAVEAEIDINTLPGGFIQEFSDFAKEMEQAQKEAEYFTAGALGAAGGPNMQMILSLVPGLLETWTGCPTRVKFDPLARFKKTCENREKSILAEWVVHLNDQHQWSWKEIIKWMKSIGADLTVREEVKHEDRRDRGIRCSGYHDFDCPGHLAGYHVKSDSGYLTKDLTA
jgi:hypothetical protein